MILEQQLVHLSQIPCRRVKCGGCKKSWTLRPPGLAPRRHYQLDVVAQASARYLFDPQSTEQSVAEAHDCSRRSVGRWLRWLTRLACPAELQRRLVEHAEQPLLAPIAQPAALEQRCPGRTRQALLILAARVLGLFELLGAAMGVAPPGLQGVLEKVLEGRDQLATYAAPSIPELAPGPANKPRRSW